MRAGAWGVRVCCVFFHWLDTMSRVFRRAVMVVFYASGKAILCYCTNQKRNVTLTEAHNKETVLQTKKQKRWVANNNYVFERL